MTDQVKDAVDYHESRDSDSDSEDEWEQNAQQLLVL